MSPAVWLQRLFRPFKRKPTPALSDAREALPNELNALVASTEASPESRQDGGRRLVMTEMEQYTVSQNGERRLGCLI